MRRIALAAAPAILVLLTAPVAAAPSRSADFQRDVMAVIDTHCAACHNGVRRTGGLALDIYRGRGERAAAQDLDVWRAVADSLESGEMPPQDRPQPRPAEIDGLLRWIDQVRRTADAAAGTPDPGRVTVRRLNRAEYRYTVRDLLGGEVDADPARDLPGDDVGHGFDNVGDALTVSPLLVERYLAAAERIATRAIVAEPQAERRKIALRLRQTGAPRRSTVLVAAAATDAAGATEEAVPLTLLSAARPATAEHEFPVDAEYEVQVVAALPPGLTARPPEGTRLAVRVDGRTLETFALAALGQQPVRRAVRTRIDRGRWGLELAVVDGGSGGREQPAAAPATTEVVGIAALRIDGPLPGTQAAAPASHERIIFHPPGVGPAGGAQAARAFLARLASRAYRRPATPAEIERLASLVDRAVSEGETFERGMQRALQAVLVSPHFLFRVELDDGSGRMPQPLTSHQLASRLSYFLWSSLPDDELARVADDGSLARPEVLAAQVRRMLADPKGQRLVSGFFAQWLQLGVLASHRPAPQQFPGFDEDLRAAMLEETRLFVGEVVKQDLPLGTLLDADFTFANERLARHYGIDGVEGGHFRRVSLAGSARGGLFGQASLLTLTSMPGRTSPVRRGRFILETFLGAAPPPPPSGPVPALDRGRDPACARCHLRMEGLGTPLENFDAVGGWRDRDGAGAPIDNRGGLPGAAAAGPRGLKTLLAGRFRSFRRALARRLLSYALGRGLTPGDRPALDRICDESAAEGDQLSSLVVAIARSAPFAQRRAESLP